MRKVLLITAEYEPFSWGGISTISKLYVLGWLRLGYDVFVSTFTDSPNSYEMHQPTGELVTYCSTKSYANEYHSIYWKGNTDLDTLAKMFFNYNRELIGDSSIIICNNEELLSVCKLIKTQFPEKHIFYFCHGLQKLENPLNTELNKSQESIIDLCDMTLTASKFMESEVRRDYPDKYICQLPPPFQIYEDWLIKYESHKRHGFVSAGRMVAQKGFDYLISEYATLTESLKNNSLHIYTGHGNEQYRKYCYKLLEKNNLPKTIIQSWVNGEILYNILASSSLFIMCSRFEPLGMIAAESLLVGTPVISTCVGGIPELLNYNDNLFFDMNRGELCALIERVENDVETRNRIALQGRQNLLDSFSIEKMYARWKEII